VSERNGTRAFRITALAFGLALLLCAAGGTTATLLSLRWQDRGQPTEVAAVDGFLRAVYTGQSVSAADPYICPEARGRGSVQRTVDDVRDTRSRQPTATFTWSTPRVGSRQGASATVRATVRLVVDGEERGSQRLRFSVIRTSGWFVCGVRQDG
jgi:hypothetical protein